MMQHITKALLAHVSVNQSEAEVAWFVTNRGSEAADPVKQAISKGLHGIGRNPEGG